MRNSNKSVSTTSRNTRGRHVPTTLSKFCISLSSGYSTKIDGQPERANVQRLFYLDEMTPNELEITNASSIHEYNQVSLKLNVQFQKFPPSVRYDIIATSLSFCIFASPYRYVSKSVRQGCLRVKDRATFHFISTSL